MITEDKNQTPAPKVSDRQQSESAKIDVDKGRKKNESDKKG